MTTVKILLWDEVDHEKEFPWPTPKALPKEYITPPTILACMPESPIVPPHMRKYSREEMLLKSCQTLQETDLKQ
jgi:hypothetical protein